MLTSAECLAILKEKERKKRELEQEKENRKKVREEKKKQQEEKLKKAEQKALREEERKRKCEIKEEKRKRKEQGRAAKRLKASSMNSATTEAHTSAHTSGSVQPTRRSLRECTNTLVTKRVQVDTEDSTMTVVAFNERIMSVGPSVVKIRCTV